MNSFIKPMAAAFATVVAAFFLVSCVAGPSRDMPRGELSIPDDTTTQSAGELRIAPLDVIEIRVFGVPELDGEYQVDSNGGLRLPLVGELDTASMTTFELATELERLYGARYMVSPQITVRLTTETRLQITVEGAVEEPGIYPISGALSLLQAVALAGGPRRGADLDNVIIFRVIEGERQAARFDLEAIRGGQSQDPAVFGNDVVVLLGNNNYENYSEVLRAIPVLGIFVRGW